MFTDITFYGIKIEYYFVTASIIYLYDLFYKLTSSETPTDYVKELQKYDEVLSKETESEEAEEAEESEYEENEYEDFSQRLSELEQKLESEVKLFEKMNRIEQMSSFLEKEKEKGDLTARLSVLEKYEFNLSDFNNFSRCVYESTKEQSKCKKHTQIMKKIGKMWRELPDYEKIKYKY